MSDRAARTPLNRLREQVEQKTGRTTVEVDRTTLRALVEIADVAMSVNEWLMRLGYTEASNIVGTSSDAWRHSMSEGTRTPPADEAYAALRAHPCYDRCFRLYRNALIDWNASGAIQNAAATLGMDRRAYCDSRLSANQFQWVGSGTGDPFTQAHAEAAYLAAVESAGV